MYNNEFEFGNEMEFGNEYGQETAAYEFSNEAEMNQELHESLEMELAHELLNVNSEQEMNYFLGKMFKSIGRGVRNFANSSVGKALGGALKSVAKKALPIAGSALGGMLGGPAGAMIGGKLAGAASNLFELELEGLDELLKDHHDWVAPMLAACRRARAARSPCFGPNTSASTNNALCNVTIHPPVEPSK